MPTITTAAVRRPRLLDLYCCQGGAARGYHDAGFDVTGIDVEPQPRYPFAFVQADALEYLAGHWREFDAVHASPPCHDHSVLANATGADGTAHLLADTRAALQALPLPWVIENVPGAAMRADFKLCGCMFALPGLRRERWFETSWHGFELRAPCHHTGHAVTVAGHGALPHEYRRGWAPTQADRNNAMGIDWMTRDGLAQAIPPAYTRVIGAHLLDQLTASSEAVA
jgi:DNA (cytosine-5)-methyltransferase 1